MWTRKGFLAAGGALAVAGCGGGDDEQRAREARVAADLEIVRSLLRVERVAAGFWAEVVRGDALEERGAARLAAEVARNERLHVETLAREERRLGGEPDAPPRTNFGAIVAAGPGEILRSGAELANLAAAAYAGQANRIQDRNLLASVLAIHTVEGRQAAALARETGDDAEPFPDGAFAEPLTIAKVRSRLARFAA
jgi:Ferritin-like domain